MKKILSLLLCLCLFAAVLSALPTVAAAVSPTPATVTFDPGAFGKLGSKRAFVTVGECIGLLPVPANKTLQDGDFNRRFFVGWSLNTDSEVCIDASYSVAGDVTLYAVWREADAMPFTDVITGAWYYDAVDYCYSLHLAAGTDADSFRPADLCSRAAVVCFLYRMAGSPDADTRDNPFSDVAETDWYYDAVLWAAEHQIAAGVGDGSFAPNDRITRQQLACLMTRYAAFCALCDPHAYTALTAFPDAKEVSEWAYDSMRWAVGSQLFCGRQVGAQTLLAPNGTVSRAEAVTVLLSYLKLTDCAATFFCLPYAVTVPNLWRGSVTATPCERGLAFYSQNSQAVNTPLCSVVFSPVGTVPDCASYEVFGHLFDNKNDALVCDVLLCLPTEADLMTQLLSAERGALYPHWHDVAIYSHYAYFKASTY